MRQEYQQRAMARRIRAGAREKDSLLEVKNGT